MGRGLVCSGRARQMCYFKRRTNLNIKIQIHDPFGNWVKARTGDIKFPIKNPYTGREDYPLKVGVGVFPKSQNQKKSERGFVFKRSKKRIAKRRKFNKLSKTSCA